MRLSSIREGDIVQTREGGMVMVVGNNTATITGHVIGRPLQLRTLKSREVAARWSRRSS